MNTKKRLPIVGAFLAIAVLTACTSQPKDDNTAPQPNNPTPSKEPIADKSSEKADLVVYGGAGNTEEEFNNRWGNALKAKFPNYNLKYIMNQKGSTLPELITAGQPIDIIFDSIGGAAGNLIQNEFQFDITDLVKKHNVDLSRFEPTFLEATKQLGGLYGLPVNGGGLVLYYNKDIFDKFGVAYPVDGMTWDDLLALSKKVTKNEGGKQYAGFATSVTHPMRMNPMSMDIVDKTTLKAAVENDKWKQFIQNVIVDPIVQDAGYKTFIQEKKGMLFTNDFAKEQNLAMFAMNFGLQYAVKEFETLNWDMVSLPTFKDKPGIGSQPYPNFFFITASSKYKDAAMEVLKYVTSDEHELIESKKGNIPVLKNEEIKKVFGQDTAFKNKNMKNAVFHNPFAAPHARTIYDDKVIGAIDANIKKVIYGEADLNTAFRVAQEEANKAIDEMKLKK
ncbi:ABC transporter substrate-binding protein [Paenibacillus sp. UNC451MF]|uniref:ABC transporter substrate-binding protein n=1 Tax=Paenibacillus sp. UNC451MF TaxID=1449063 RepID=UPI000491C859|nr:extracellular solute-binding protein [Paenibacillus sp. UNC451MF]